MSNTKGTEVNYLNSAINSLYGEDDDFILIGLTGRTGSGCSRVADILRKAKSEIKHSLFSGDNPTSNEDRKQKIVKHHFENTWQAFSVIQVSSVLTLLLVKNEIEKIRDFIVKLNLNLKEELIDSSLELLKEIKKEIKQHKDVKIFYTEWLPKKCTTLRDTIGKDAFVTLYQKIGTNVRLSGNPILDKTKNGKFFTLAKTINTIVKELRKEVKNNRGESKQKTLIAIDAIRNPLEALFFQKRYAAFFLMAVSCDETDRKRRLRDSGYTEDGIRQLDKQEYSGGDLSAASSFSIQDIKGCLQKADLYINNPDEKDSVSEYQNLANQVIRFVSLMERPGLVTPTSMERCMQIAYNAKLNSGCISRQVGAVITNTNFAIQAVGWNDTPHGQVPCNLRNRFELVSGKDQEAYSQFERNNHEYLNEFKKENKSYTKIQSKSNGRNVSYCFKSEYNKLKDDGNQVHTRALHAEENAFMQISKYGGRGIEGGRLFSTASPCELCAKKAYQLGIKHIYYIDPYPGIATDQILKGGTNNPELILFSGAIGRAFLRLYTPIVPYKDELKALIHKEEKPNNQTVDVDGNVLLDKELANITVVIKKKKFGYFISEQE
ncbi:MAG: anti-phage dCTP deaminase [Gallionella sp.]|nr:anti-phage dCTP deaminase [Gallionella sp.]MDD4958089.1 anti-phage dCTP deaminase [Gallionella sp.]